MSLRPPSLHSGHGAPSCCLPGLVSLLLHMCSFLPKAWGNLGPQAEPGSSSTRTSLAFQWLHTSRTVRPCSIAQGTLLNVMWQPGWQGNLGEHGYHTAESLHCSHETITTLLISYTLLQNRKFNKIKDSMLPCRGCGFHPWSGN